MFQIIGGDGKEYGPLSVAQIIDYIEDNRASANTLTKAANTSDWLPLSSFPEFAEPLGRKGMPPPLPAHKLPGSAAPLFPPDIPNYMVAAIFVNLCFCPVVALPALFYAAQVTKKVNAGDIPGARLASANARKWCWIGFIAGAISFAAYSLLIGNILKW
ncbi:MAG TPA: CD225/dispanin family protein [Candidatus Saccharimonadales bacterium]|nr:CD225/dispanin family protein [Candidatus Saccharimonadales bacterium]